MVEEARQEPAVISAKDAILGEIRYTLGKRKTERESDYAYIQRQYHVAGERSVEARLDLFADRLHDYGATVYECGESGIAVTIGAALRERKLRQLLTGREFPSAWIPSDFEFYCDEEFNPYQIERFDGVVTRCALAIAETGTIVLRHAGDEARRAVSLIPDYHLCVVFAAQVVQRVPEGVRQMAAMGAAPLTTISGPSATSDIEMTRIKGVHGPRVLDVVLVV